MPKPTPCPYCKKAKPKQHQRFCNKNPHRVKGPGRPSAAQEQAPPAASAEAAPAAPEPAVSPAGNDGAVPAPIAPDFTVADTGRTVEAMPNLEPTTATAPPPAPPVVPPMAVGPLMDVLCGIFDRSLVQADGSAPDAPPPPPQPITTDERRALAAAMDPLFAKYLPKLGPYAIEVNAILVTAAVFGPRLLQAKARNAWIEDHKRPTQLPAPNAAPRPTEDDLLRIGDKWVGRVSQ